MLGSVPLLLLACLSSPADDGIAFHIEPYLQWPDRDAITVMWETTQPKAGVVFYGTSPELDLRVNEPEARSVHEVRLTGLLPRTRYFYRVVCDDLKSPIASFRTPPGPEEPWRLVVYGDSRSYPDRHQRIAELAAQFDPDLIVHTGDQVARGTQRPLWKSQFFDPAARLFSRVPIITSLGNHEQNAGNYYEYLSLPGNESYFSLDFGDLHLIILDSNTWGKSARESDQFAWLKADLDRPRTQTRWTAVAFHHPLFSAHDKRGINPARWDWCPVFQELGVDFVLTGHDHFYYRSWPIGRLAAGKSRGIPHITTAGGGAPIYRMKQRSYTAVEHPVHHLSVLDFHGDVIRGKSVDLEGTIFDEYEINKTPTPATEFCAYEVYELERAIRRELESRPPLVVSAHEKSVALRDEFTVPHTFRVPVSARLSWSDLEPAPSQGPADPVPLVPDQPLVISMAREVSLDCLASEPTKTQRLPHMRLEFLDDRFRNREIEFSPLKIWRDLTVSASKLPRQPSVKSLLDGTAFERRDFAYLIHSDGSQKAPVPVDVQLAHTDHELFALVAVQDPQTTPATDQRAQAHKTPADILKIPHVRLVVSAADHLHCFAVSLDGRRAYNYDGVWGSESNWAAYIRRQSNPGPHRFGASRPGGRGRS